LKVSSTAQKVDLWEGEAAVEEEVFLRVLRETAEALAAARLPHVFMGGLASAALGRPRWTHDIDVFVRPQDNRRVLEVLEGAGFTTQETDAAWLFKALKDDVLVDIIFRSAGSVVLDKEMVTRARRATVAGAEVLVISAEDLIVIKALVFKERAPRHWYDALALLQRTDLDWGYLIKRALAYDFRRVLSLLVYARSEDRAVPAETIQKLFDAGSET
jgi:predicted nucleotidyltransferase